LRLQRNAANGQKGNTEAKTKNMKGLDNPTYLFMLIAFNVLALIFLFAAVKWPRISRLLFSLLFGWACWMNWTTSQRSPNDYLQYADLNLSSWYRDFINGWFSRHIPLAVGIIATSQGMIALSMLLKGWIFKIGCIGGIIFLLAIAPFGVGSGFPCTIIFAMALVILFKKGKEFLWKVNSLVNL
jgi:hypothetical protein